jgi:hypothetical protein
MMWISRSRQGFPRSVLVAALMAGAIALAGCSAGSVIGDHMPNALGGLPEGAPQRAAKPSAYPAVHDMPPRRQNAVLTEAEQKAAEAELAALRARQAQQVATPPKN